MILLSTITCPNCRNEARETMPCNACQFFYECKGCGALLRPKAGDCCVFCSYADIPCPPRQETQTSDCCAEKPEGVLKHEAPDDK